VLSVVVGIVYSGRAGREVGGCIDPIGGVDQGEGGAGRVGDPGDSPELDVVGIDVDPAAQRSSSSKPPKHAGARSTHPISSR
jgi:hypothetical protein